ncbi:MAG TPA: hypothetical protein VIT67_11610 [Povalibacter sp.]
MTRLQHAMAYITLAGMLCACGAPSPPDARPAPDAPPPPDVPVSPVEDFPKTLEGLRFEISQAGMHVDHVDRLKSIIVTRDIAGDDRCVNPPAPNYPPVNPIAFGRGFAAVELFNADREAGKETTIIRCRPAD